MRSLVHTTATALRRHATRIHPSMSAIAQPQLHLLPASSSCHPRRSAFSYPTPRALDEIVKLPQLLQRDTEDIKKIWAAQEGMAAPTAGGETTSGEDSQQQQQQHTGLLISDCMSAEEMDTFNERAKRAPLFVVPCFRLSSSSPSNPSVDSSSPSLSAYDSFDTTSGFEVMLVNVQSPSLLITSLEEYKLRGAHNASPYAVMTLYDDLAASKGVVLVRGEVMEVSVLPPQLRQMWSLLRALYCDPSNESSALFEQYAAAFNKKPNPTFDFEAYIQQCKKKVAEMAFKPTPKEATVQAARSRSARNGNGNDATGQDQKESVPEAEIVQQ